MQRVGAIPEVEIQAFQTGIVVDLPGVAAVGVAAHRQFARACHAAKAEVEAGVGQGLRPAKRRVEVGVLPAGVRELRGMGAAIDHRGLHAPGAGTIAAGQRPLAEVPALETVAEVCTRHHAGATQGDTLRAAWRIVGDAQAGAATAVSRRGKGHAHRARGVRSQGCAAGVGLSKVARIGAAESDRADRQRRRAAIGHRDRLSSTGRAHILGREGQAARVEADPGSRGSPRPAQGHTLRTARSVVGDAQAGATTAVSRRGKGHAHRARGVRSQGCAAGVGLSKVARIGATDRHVTDRQGRRPAIGHCDRLGSTGRAHILGREGQAARVEADRRCGIHLPVVGVGDGHIIPVDSANRVVIEHELCIGRGGGEVPAHCPQRGAIEPGLAAAAGGLVILDLDAVPGVRDQCIRTG